MIIDSTDIRNVRPISENVNDGKRLQPYISECEKLFLMPAIGPALYKELDSDDKPDYYELLMNGGYYNNDTKYFAGLREAMGYLVYSRFVRNQNINATAFGIVAKKSDYSEKVDYKEIMAIANDAEKIGLEYLKQCIDYMNFGKKPEEKRNILVKSKFKVIGRYGNN